MCEVNCEEMREDREKLRRLEKKMLIYAQVCLLSYLRFPAEMVFLACIAFRNTVSSFSCMVQTTLLVVSDLEHVVNDFYCISLAENTP